MKKFLEKTIVRLAGEVQDRSAAALTGDRIKLGGVAEGLAVVIVFGDGVHPRDIKPALNQHTAASAGSSKVLNALATGRIYTMHAADYATLAAGTGFTKETQATADEEFVDADSGEMSGITVFEIFASDLDSAGGYQYVSCDLGDPGGAKVIGVLYILHDLKYAAAPEAQADPLA